MMPQKTKAVLAFLSMLLMFAISIGFGAVSGWHKEYNAVQQMLLPLNDVLDARREVGYNTLTVAKRHLPKDDKRIEAVTASISALEKSLSLVDKHTVNTRLTKEVKALLSALSDSSSIQQDERDTMYVNQLLPQALEQSEIWVDQSAYDNSAERYNNGLTKTLSGHIARLFGARPAERFASPVAEE